VRRISLLLGNLAELEFGEGQVEQALRLAGEALEIDSRGRNQVLLAASYDNVAAYRIALGDVVGAREAAGEGLRLARQAQNALLSALALQHLRAARALRAEVRRAAGLIGYVDAQYKEIGSEA
jgi:hypothetical protein